MSGVLYIAKAATPEQTSWRRRIARNEQGLLRLFRLWVGELRDAISDNQLAQAIITGATRAFDHVVQAVTFQPVEQLRPVTTDEAVRAFEQLQGVDARLVADLNLRDPNFQQAIDTQGARLVREVSDETRQAIRILIERAYQSGEHPFQTVAELRRLVGLTRRQTQAVLNFRSAQRRLHPERPDLVTARTTRYADRMLTRRAQTIARTETARAQILGQQEAWRQAEARGLIPETAMMVWQSVQTDPSEVCYQLDGEERPLGETFDGMLPPVHPNCLPGDSRIASRTAVTGATKRWYDGDLVIVRTAGGRELASTPNHPVLTPRGWVPSGLLNVGDHVIREPLAERMAIRDVEDEQMPARIEDVAEAFLGSRDVAPIPVPVAAPDFHGDGKGSEVAVVASDGLLRDRREAALLEHAREPLLQTADSETALLSRERSLTEVGVGSPSSSRGSVGGGHLSRANLRVHSLPFSPLGLARISHLDAALNEPTADGGPAHAEAVRQFLLRATGEVLTDQVVDVDVQAFHGFVYNLETMGGFYEAEGIAVHNCRCSLRLEMRRPAREDLVSRLQARIPEINARYGL